MDKSNLHIEDKLKKNAYAESECKKKVEFVQEEKQETKNKLTKDLIKDCIKDWCESTTSHGKLMISMIHFFNFYQLTNDYRIRKYCAKSELDNKNCMDDFDS